MRRPILIVVICASVATAIWLLVSSDAHHPRTQSEEVARERRARTLVFGTTHEPTTLDPLFSRIAAEAEPIELIHRGLIAFDDAWRLQPRAAVTLPIATTSSGAFRVDWQLRDDLVWSDGHALTAEDAKMAHRIESDPSIEAQSHEVAARIDRVEVVSPTRFSMFWRAPDVGYAAPRAHGLVPHHAYPTPAPGHPFNGTPRQPLSNGPYRVAEWVEGQYIAFERNPHWHGPTGTIDRIVFRFLETEDALEAELETGGIDALGEAAGLGVDRAERLGVRLAKTHVVHTTNSGMLLHLACRIDHPILGRLDVRRAIAMAIDRARLGALVYGANATAAAGIFPTRHPAHDRERAVPTVDIERARALVGDARGVELALEFASGSAMSERAATVVGSDLERIGLVPILRPLPLSVLMTKMKEGAHAPLVLYALRTRPDWDGRSLMHSAGTQNASRFSDPEIDRALDNLRTEMNPTRWAENVLAVERRYLESAPVVPLAFRPAVSVRPKRLKGWRPTGTTTPVTWNAELWRLEAESATTTGDD